MSVADVWNEWLQLSSTYPDYDQGKLKDNGNGNCLTSAANNALDEIHNLLQKASGVVEITNPAIVYVASYAAAGSQPIKSMIEALATNFSENDLNKSKHILHENKIISENKKRRGDDSHMATAKDVVDGIYKIANTIKWPTFRFVMLAEDLQRIPRYSPEQLSNTPDVLRRLALLESEMKKANASHINLEQQVSLNTGVCEQLAQSTSSNQPPQAKNNNISKSSLSKAINNVNNQNANKTPKRKRNSPHHGSEAVGASNKVAIHDTGDEFPTPTTVVRKSMPYLAAASATPKLGQVDDDDPFKTVISKNTRKMQRRGIQGNKVDDTLKGGSEKLELVISRVRKCQPKENLITYAEKNGVQISPNDVSLLTKHTDEAYTYAYKLAIKREDKDKVMNKEFWPAGIYVDWFRRKRTEKEGAGGGSFDQPQMDHA